MKIVQTLFKYICNNKLGPVSSPWFFSDLMSDVRIDSVKSGVLLSFWQMVVENLNIHSYD